MELEIQSNYKRNWKKFIYTYVDIDAMWRILALEQTIRETLIPVC